MQLSSATDTATNIWNILKEFLQGKQSCCWNVTAVSLDRQDGTANLLQTAASKTANQVNRQP